MPSVTDAVEMSGLQHANPPATQRSRPLRAASERDLPLFRLPHRAGDRYRQQSNDDGAAARSYHRSCPTQADPGVSFLFHYADLVGPRRLDVKQPSLRGRALR